MWSKKSEEIVCWVITNECWTHWKYRTFYKIGIDEIGNRVTVISRSRVRIPSSPPKQEHPIRDALVLHMKGFESVGQANRPGESLRNYWLSEGVGKSEGTGWHCRRRLIHCSYSLHCNHLQYKLSRPEQTLGAGLLRNSGACPRDSKLQLLDPWAFCARKAVLS